MGTKVKSPGVNRDAVYIKKECNSSAVQHAQYSFCQSQRGVISCPY